MKLGFKILFFVFFLSYETCDSDKIFYDPPCSTSDCSRSRVNRYRSTNNRRRLKFSISIHLSFGRILKEVFITLNHKICQVVHFTSFFFLLKTMFPPTIKRGKRNNSKKSFFYFIFSFDKNPLENTHIYPSVFGLNFEPRSNSSITLASNFICSRCQ